MSLFPPARPGNAVEKGRKSTPFSLAIEIDGSDVAPPYELETGGMGTGPISVLRRIVRRLYVDDRMHPGMDAAFEQVLAFAESF